MASIGVDATFVRPGVVGGAQQMLENLLDALAATAEPDDRLVAFGRPSREGSPGAKRFRWVAAPSGGNRFLQSWRILRTHASGLDSIVFPNYFTPPGRRARRPRLVTVIHDLQYRTFPENFSRAKRLWLRYAHAATLRNADVVVTVSDHVRHDLLQRHGSRFERKLIAIPNPISWERFELGSDEPAFAADGRYVLSVSAHYPHKNLGTLLRAFADLRSRAGFDDVVLVLVGQRSDRLIGMEKGMDLEAEAGRLGIAGAVRFTGYLSDGAVGSLYRGASLFVFPSLFEGFGMPAVEALGHGLPVLTTRCEAIPETTLGLATYVEDPRDAGEMADAMAAMISSPDTFRPDASSVERIRAVYALERIGGLYRRALTG